MAVQPTWKLEAELLQRYPVIAGMDEVGRGALAGPVSVAVAVATAQTSARFPLGLADSKQLTPRRRAQLAPQCRKWLHDCAVGHASAAEIDAFGIMTALRLAGLRALQQVSQRGNLPAAIILDGNANWLFPVPQIPLRERTPDSALEAELGAKPVVHTQVKADAHCALVAAASVIAKVERDQYLCALPDPGYGWAANKGYGSAAHLEALRRLGASCQHRRSWKIPGL